MIKRDIQNIAREIFKQFPVLTITGPRQSGKTVLVRDMFGELPYFSLEDPDIRSFAIEDPRGFLNQMNNHGIIDEIQRVPELTSYIQTIVDRDNKSGMFILTGSSQFELHNAVTQSLSGRTAILNLLPFTIGEAYQRSIPSHEEIIYTGFYPRIFDQKIDPSLFIKSYIDTYVQKDVRELMEIRNLRSFERFLRLCAGRTGQVLNMNNLGNECGVSHKTISSWISVLEASFIIYLLPPFHTNFNKRIIKSPKIYFLDVGLAAHLLGIESPAQLSTHPLKGELFETMIISEFIKFRFNLGKQANYYFFRDNSGNEVDLLFERSGTIFPIEIKSGQTIHYNFFRGIQYFKSIAKTKAGKGAVIYGGSDFQDRTNLTIAGYKHIHSLLEEIMI
ncbi:MAG: ATP-binding protein [Fidelibacterota bacterium]